MNDKGGKIDESDRELFRSAIGSVRPLRNDQVEPEPKRPAPVPRQRQADEIAALSESLTRDADQFDVETGEELFYLRPGLQKGVGRKLKRGQFRIEADLDLHGLRLIDARKLLSVFVAECRHDGRQCVRIVHGKGLRSDGEGPILKPMLNEWLRQRDDVLAFCSARRSDGGTGAVYVLLRRASG